MYERLLLGCPISSKVHNQLYQVLTLFTDYSRQKDEKIKLTIGYADNLKCK